MPEGLPTTRKPKHAVILCHPELDSFNAAVAKRYCETVQQFGHEVVLRDLYRMGFDPVLKANEQAQSAFTLSPDVVNELKVIDGTDVFVLVYPIWFAMPPAMLKGYVDRVFGAGVSFRSVRNRQTTPLLYGKRLVSFTSSGTTLSWLAEQGAWVSLQNLFDHYLLRGFSMNSAEHKHYDSIVEGLEKRFVDEYLYDVEQNARRICGTIDN